MANKKNGLSKVLQHYGCFDIREKRTFDIKGKQTGSEVVICSGRKVVRGDMKNQDEAKAYIDG